MNPLRRKRLLCSSLLLCAFISLLFIFIVFIFIIIHHIHIHLNLPHFLFLALIQSLMQTREYLLKNFYKKATKKGKFPITFLFSSSSLFIHPSIWLSIHSLFSFILLPFLLHALIFSPLQTRLQIVHQELSKEVSFPLYFEKKAVEREGKFSTIHAFFFSRPFLLNRYSPATKKDTLKRQVFHGIFSISLCSLEFLS